MLQFVLKSASLYFKPGAFWGRSWLGEGDEACRCTDFKSKEKPLTVCWVSKTSQRTGNQNLAGKTACHRYRWVRLASTVCHSSRSSSSLRDRGPQWRRSLQSVRLRGDSASARSRLCMEACAKWTSTTKKWAQSATCWVAWPRLQPRGQSLP